jgi:hypothetical protein
VTLLTFGAFAQGNSGKNKKEKHTESRTERDDYKKDKKDKAEDRYDNMKDRRNDRKDEMKDRRDDQTDRRSDDRNGAGKYSKNTPRKVGDAFRRDYPNATNVSWTKDRGVWTATFGGGVLGLGTRTASYKANGQRVGQVDSRTRTRTGGIFN